MKKIILIVTLMATTICNAQIQQGYVKTIGKKGQRGEPLNGVILKTNYAKSSPVVSSPDGKFSFTVNGNKFQMSNIQKTNYRLADEDVIGRDYLYTPTSPVIFAMVSLNEYRKTQRAIEERALKKYEPIFNQRIKQLEDELERRKIDNNEYAQRIAELEQETATFQNMISKLSDRYARTDYDDIDSLDILINQYIEEGEYDMAATLVDSKGDLRKRIENTKEREKNAAILRSMAEKETLTAKREKNSIINDLGVKIQIARSKIQLDSVQYWIECRADYDSTNVEFQIEALENILSDEYHASSLDENSYWDHINNNRRYVYRAIESLKVCGKECSKETLRCFSLLNSTYQIKFHLLGDFDSKEAMAIADKMIEIERIYGIPAVEGLSVFYNNLSTLASIHGLSSQKFKNYYQKSLDEKYEESALQLYKNTENPYTLFSLYQSMTHCISDKNKRKEIDRIRLNLYLNNKDIDLGNTVDVVQIYRDLGEPGKAIEYQKTLVAELVKQNELNNNIESRRKLLEQYKKLVDYLEEAKDYKSMCKYTWELYDLYRTDKEQFSTYSTRFECAKYLQKHVSVCILSNQFSGLEKNIIDCFKLAEDASALRRYEYLDFIYWNYIYLSQVYAAQRNYALALTTIDKAKQISPDKEEAKIVELNITKKAKK